VVSLVLFFAWLAHTAGAPVLLGGFAAGIALSRRFALPMGMAMRSDEHFAHRVEEQLRPVVHLFTPIFFVTVGLSLDFRATDWGSPFIWQFSLSLLLAAAIGKLAAGFLIRETRFRQAVIGLAMVPRGEVGLIFAELGRSSGIFVPDVYAVLVLVIALTTLAPPFVLKWLYGSVASGAGK
jgi:Kef-type K+ transport system membrane component KefB